VTCRFSFAYIYFLSTNRFWSHVLFDKEFLNPLLYFLQEATPFYIPLRQIAEDNEAVVQLYEKLCRNALVIVCRLITNRESDEEFMSKEKQAEIIYKNFVISIPMLFDIVTLFGYSNKNLVQKIVDTLLKIEPQFTHDLKMGLKFILSTFVAMRKQLEVTESENRELFDRYEDITLYLMNIACTLNLVIDLAPNEVKAFCTRDLHLESAIASLYDNFIPQLYQNSVEVDANAWFLTYLNYSRVELINCYRTLLNRGVSAIRHKIADGVLMTLTECAGYKTFIIDYVRLYPIEIDLDVISQGGKNM
jgi:activating signal cointegrator complex subunit 2